MQPPLASTELIRARNPRYKPEPHTKYSLGFAVATLIVREVHIVHRSETTGGMELSTILVLGALFGTLTHRLIFIRGEWHLQAPQLFLGHTILLFTLIGSRIYSRGETQIRIRTWINFNLVFFIGYPVGLYLSMVVYRYVHTILEADASFVFRQFSVLLYAL